MTLNKLKINVEKSSFIMFGSKHKIKINSTDEIVLCINDEKLKYMPTLKYLGITLDETLDESWGPHVDNICKKIGQRNGMLCRLMSVLPRESLNVIYKTLILPLFDYAMPVWGWTSQNNLNKLQKHQSRAARIVTNDFSLDKKGIDVVHSLDWLNVRERINFITNIMTFKCINNMAPGYLCHMLKFNNVCHNLNTRNVSLLHFPKPNCEKFREAFCYQGPKNWNMLPQDLKHVENICLFKRMLKQFILNKP